MEYYTDWGARPSALRHAAVIMPDRTDLVGDFADKVVRPLHESFIYNRRVNALAKAIVAEIPAAGELTGLDVGCGHGAIARLVENARTNVKMVGADVLVRPEALLPVTEFDGRNLPYDDNSFDFVMLVDVIHHAEDQQRLLSEVARVARQFVLIKDHLCESPFDFITLQLMDWVGNRAHGVNLPYKYLSKREWLDLYRRTGIKVVTENTALNLYAAPTSFIAERRLHFLAKLVPLDLDQEL